MTESTMRAMQELISPQRETGELRSDINRLASEFVRVTALLGEVTNQMGNTIQTQEQRISQGLTEWSTEFEKKVEEVLQMTVPGGTRKALEDLQASIPTWKDMEDQVDLSTNAKMRAVQTVLDRRIREQTEQEWEKVSDGFQAHAEQISNIQKLSLSRAQELAAQVSQI